MEGYAAAVATYERVGKFYAQQGFSLKAIAVYKQIREIIDTFDLVQQVLERDIAAALTAEKSDRV